VVVAKATFVHGTLQNISTKTTTTTTTRYHTKHTETNNERFCWTAYCDATDTVCQDTMSLDGVNKQTVPAIYNVKVYFTRKRLKTETIKVGGGSSETSLSYLYYCSLLYRAIHIQKPMWNFGNGGCLF